MMAHCLIPHGPRGCCETRGVTQVMRHHGLVVRSGQVASWRCLLSLEVRLCTRTDAVEVDSEPCAPDPWSPAGPARYGLHMRWSATLGGWNRRKTVLAACLAAAAALVAPAVAAPLPRRRHVRAGTLDRSLGAFLGPDSPVAAHEPGRRDRRR